MADVVADELRSQILSGHLAEGAAVPKQEELVASFRVSPPSIREALRILETEGLISIVRGNVGGAIVHTPRSDGVAYMAALVLEAQRAHIDDVYAGIRAIEPICATMAAQRKDRKRSVVPVLKASIAEQRAANNQSDAWRFFWAARTFHSQLVSCSGSTTMSLIAGALESIWASQLNQFDPDAATSLGVYATDSQHAHALEAHQEILDAIARGDGDAAGNILHQHLIGAEPHPLLGQQQPIRAARLLSYLDDS